MKEKSLKVLVIVLTILVVGLGGFIVYDKVLNNKNTNNDNKNNKQEEKKYKLNVFVDNRDNLCDEESDTCSLKYTLYVPEKNAKVLAIGFIDHQNSSSNILFGNEDVYFAEIKKENNNIKKTNLKNIYDEYYIIENDSSEEIGIGYKKDKDFSYLSLNNIIKDNYFEGYDADKYFLVDLKNNKVLLYNGMKEKGYRRNYHIYDKNGVVYFLEQCHCDVPGAVLYDKNLNVLNDDGLFSVSNDESLYIVNNNVVNKYSNGKKIKSFDYSKYNNKIINLISNYIAVYENDDIVLINLENDNKINTNSSKYCKNYGYASIYSALSSTFNSLNGNNIEVQFSCNDSSKLVILNVNILDNSVTIKN